MQSTNKKRGEKEMNVNIEFLIANLVFFYGLLLISFNPITSIIGIGGIAICALGIMLTALVIEKKRNKEAKKKNG